MSGDAKPEELASLMQQWKDLLVHDAGGKVDWEKSRIHHSRALWVMTMFRLEKIDFSLRRIAEAVTK